MKLVEQPDPKPEAGQLVVEVAAAGVNFMDIYQRQGVGGYRPASFPVVQGAEGEGTVMALATDVTDFSVGDRVAWSGVPHSYAEQVAIPAARAVPGPDGVGLDGAGPGLPQGMTPHLLCLRTSLLQGMTAHYLCFSTYPVQEHDVTVVHAAAGGVGLLLTQLIKRRGGVVVATTSGGPDGEKAALARAAGADHTVGYDNFRDTVSEITGGRGAHVVYDSVGQATFNDSLDALRPRGTMGLYGPSSGQVPPFDPQQLNYHGSLYLTRPTMGSYIADRDELLWRAEDLFAWIVEGQLDARIGATSPRAAAARAQEALAARRTTGKLLLLP